MTKKAKRKSKKRARGGASYPCPRCASPSHVIITRRQDGQVKRKRQCLECDHIFHTVEKA